MDKALKLWFGKSNGWLNFNYINTRRILVFLITATILCFILIQVKANSSQGQAKFKTNNIRYLHHYINYDLEVTYPQFEPGSTMAPVNAGIKSFITQEEKDLKEMTLVEAGNAQNNAPGRHCSCICEIAYASQQLVSLKFDCSYYCGGAHGMGDIKTLNYTVAPFARLTLSKLIGTGDDYKGLSNICRPYVYKQLKETGDLDASMVEEGTKPLADNFKTFTFNTKGIQIIFQPWQVARDALIVDLPYKKLDSIISNSSPLCKLKRN